MNTEVKSKPSKAVGGQIPLELYWEFKEAQGVRHETATQALEHAIRLYIDILKGGVEN